MRYRFDLSNFAASRGVISVRMDCGAEFMMSRARCPELDLSIAPSRTLAGFSTTARGVGEFAGAAEMASSGPTRARSSRVESRTVVRAEYRIHASRIPGAR